MQASDEDVKEAAQRAQIDATIRNLPAGYNTMVGERGMMISGGEKQRLAVSRLILKDPPLLFFDEAVSHSGKPITSEANQNRLRLWTLIRSSNFSKTLTAS